MKNISLIILAGALPMLSSAQTAFINNNGATINIAVGTQVIVAGSVINASGSTLTNNGVLRISGNVTNNAVISYNGGTLALEGSVAQTLGGAAAYSAKNVTINNPAGITLTAPLSVDGTLTFTNGVINATNTSYPVMFTANGTAGTPTDASHINGYVKKLGSGTFVYPIGNGIKYQPIGVNLSANSAGMTASYASANAGTAPFGTSGSSTTPLKFYNGKEYWDLAPAGTATGTVTVYFDSYNNSGIGNTADLRVAHRSGGEWLNEGGTATGTTSAGSVTSSAISTFSPFTLGSISTASPLPLTLISFTGMRAGSANRLEWQTAAEDVGMAFVVEHARRGESFTAIGHIIGSDKSTNYTFLDESPYAPATDYRLRIEKADGSYSFSSIVSLRHELIGTGEISVYPVPASLQVIVSNSIESLNGSDAVVLNARGQIVTHFPVILGTSKLNVTDWATGVYTIKFADGFTSKLVKQ
jgi:hypothetical protein